MILSSYNLRLALLPIFTSLLFVSISQAQNTQYGDVVDDISISSWISNVPVDLDIEDKFLVIDFWATWCGPCIKGVPKFNALQEAFSDRDDVLFISLSDESPEKIKRTLDRIPFETIVATDESGQLKRKLNIKGIPHIAIIGKDKRFLWSGLAPFMNKKMLEKILSDPDKAISMSKNIASASSNKYKSNPFIKSISPWFKDKTTPSVLKIGEPSRKRGTAIMQGHRFLLFYKTCVKDIIAHTQDLPKRRVISTDTTYFGLAYLNNQAKTKKKSLKALRKLTLDKFDMEMVKEKREEQSWVITIEDKSKLQPNVDDAKGGSPADGKYVYTGVQVDYMFKHLEDQVGVSFVNKTKLKGNYDFIINTSSAEAAVESLASYGLSAKLSTRKLTYFVVSGR